MAEEDAAAVSAGALCVVEGGVGAGEEGVDGVVGLGLRDSYADGDWERELEDRKRVEGLADALGEGEGVGVRGLGEDEEEFVSAVAAEEVAFEKEWRNVAGYAAEGFVSGGVALRCR